MIKWEIYKELDFPCADISYCWDSGRNTNLIITMHFSRVVGGCGMDLELVFSSPLALQWEDESYGLIELPNNLPKCVQDRFKRWTYPTLIIPNSNWADLYAANIYTKEDFKSHKVTHFAFVSMNDLLHVLSEKKPRVRLIEPSDN